MGVLRNAGRRRGPDTLRGPGLRPPGAALTPFAGERAAAVRGRCRRNRARTASWAAPAGMAACREGRRTAGDAGQLGEGPAGRRERVADALFESDGARIERRLQLCGGAEIGARGHDAEHAGSLDMPMRTPDAATGRRRG